MAAEVKPIKDVTPAKAPRKRLDEIRREIEEEFAAADMTRFPPAAGAADDDEPDAELVEALRRRPRRGRYVVAALIGCLVGQLAMLGYFGFLSYHSLFSVAPRRTVAAAPRPSPIPLAAVPSPPPAEATAAPPVSAEQLEAITTQPAPAGFAADDRHSIAREPVTREAVVKLPRPASAAPPAPPLRAFAARAGNTTGPGDWAKAQGDVRAALSAWLVTSGFGDAGVAADAVVILDIDGRIARTHLPMRWGGSVVIREQLWQQSMKGWYFVGDRQLSSD